MSWILQLLGESFRILPRPLQRFIASALGRFIQWTGFRSTIVRQNLNYAYPDQPDQQELLYRESYRHLGNLILEIFMVFGSLRKFVIKYVDFKGREHLAAAQKQGKGLIFLSSHVGNWEIMASVAGVMADVDLLLVTKHLKPEWLHQAILKGRLRYKVRATYEPKTMRDVLTQLKRNGAVGIVLDQYTGPPVGVRVPLFGHYVGTSLVPAILAKRTGAIVLPVENYRKPDGRWSVEIGPPLEWKHHDDLNYELALNTKNYVSVIEKSILAHPDQWLWIHRRFKGDLSPLREGEWSEGRVRK